MRLTNFARILLISAALAGYSAWATSRTNSPVAPLARYAADELPLLDRAQAEALWHDPGTLFLDVRSPTDFVYGHIRGALNLPSNEVKDRLPSLRPRLERATALVVYCKSKDCGSSLWAALELRRAGLTQVHIYPEGWYDWLDARLPVDRDTER